MTLPCSNDRRNTCGLVARSRRNRSRPRATNWLGMATAGLGAGRGKAGVEPLGVVRRHE